HRYFSESKFDSWIITPTKAYKVPCPEGSKIFGIIDDLLVINPSKKWIIGNRNFSEEDLVALNIKKIVNGKSFSKSDTSLIYQKNIDEFFGDNIITTKNYVAAEIIKNVRGQIKLFKNHKNTFKEQENFVLAKENTKIIDANYENDILFFTIEDFLIPKTLKAAYLNQAKSNVVY